MSDSYYTCAVCSEAFPDMRIGIRSCDTCSVHFCSQKCGKIESVNTDDDYNDPLESCVICREEFLTPQQMISMLRSALENIRAHTTCEWTRDRVTKSLKELE